MAWLFSFVLMAIQKGQDSPPPGRQLQAVPPPHLALLPLHRRHLAHHLRQLEQYWLLLPLCHPQLPLAQTQAEGPQLHRHLPRAAAGEFGHQVDILSKRQDHPQLACWISGFFWFFALYLVFAIIVNHKLLWYGTSSSSYSSSLPKFSPGPGGRGTDRLWAPYANLLTMSSARRRCQFSTKITIYFETLYLGER